MMQTLSVPPGLARSAVYRKVPIRVRCRLDRLILSRPKGCATEEAMARRLKLTEQYGVSVAALKRYARLLDRVVRPVVASQLTAAIVGCLPPEYRRNVTDGSQVLLLGKVVQALSDQATDGRGVPTQALTVADLAKLATVLRAVRPSEGGGRSNGSLAQGELKGQGSAGLGGPGGDSDILTTAVRTIFGVHWPLPTEESQQRGGQAGKADENALAGWAGGEAPAVDVS